MAGPPPALSVLPIVLLSLRLAPSEDRLASYPLREIYMPGFEAPVKEARVASLMCAYPRINGAYACENEPLLSGVLKKDWAFDGFVTSDFGVVHSTGPSALAGLDLELPTGIYFGDALKKAIQSGEIPISRIDDMLLRRFTKMVKEKSIPVLEHGAVSRQMAAKSMVLLKNDGGILPLDRTKTKRLALIGP